MKLKIKITVLSFLMLALFPFGDKLRAQDVENEYQFRTSASVSYKPVKKLKLVFTPEVRFDESFSVGKYLLEGELRYKLFKSFYLSGNYRFIINPRDENPTEYFHRFAIAAIYKKSFKRFEPAIKISYTNDSDDDNGDDANDHFLRYKASLNYDIRKCKLTPLIGIELFQQLGNNGLYKVRYKAGFDYKLFKNNYIGVNYKLDYYMQEYTNKHIFSIGYKIKL